MSFVAPPLSLAPSALALHPGTGSLISHGAFHGARVSQLLQSIARHDHPMLVTLCDADGSPTGRVIVGHGMVEHAETGGLSGRDAFFALCGARATSYAMAPAMRGARPQPPVGPLGALLLEASVRGSEAVRPSVATLPPIPALPPLARRAAPAATAAVASDTTRRFAAPVVVDEKPQAVIAVVSAWHGAGRSTIAAGLARAFARRGARTALVDVEGNAEVASHAMVRGVSAHTMRPADVQDPARWRAVLSSLQRSREVVVLDAPAGYRGTAGLVLGSATHWLAVIPVRGGWSASVAPPEAVPPSDLTAGLRPAGIVYNGFNRAPSTTLPAMRASDCQQLVLDTVLPWSPMFSTDDKLGGTDWLFDAIADEITPRLLERRSPRFASGTLSS